MLDVFSLDVFVCLFTGRIFLFFPGALSARDIFAGTGTLGLATRTIWHLAMPSHEEFIVVLSLFLCILVMYFFIASFRYFFMLVDMSFVMYCCFVLFIVYLFACLRACLLACLLVCLVVCLFVCLLACLLIE